MCAQHTTTQEISDGLSNDGFSALAVAAAKCPCLVSISLGYSTRVGEAGCVALGRALPQCAQLQHLSLNGCVNIGSEGVEMLAPCIPKVTMRLITSCAMELIIRSVSI